MQASGYLAEGEYQKGWVLFKFARSDRGTVGLPGYDVATASQSIENLDSPWFVCRHRPI